jgi:hypothetical protein
MEKNMGDEITDEMVEAFDTAFLAHQGHVKTSIAAGLGAALAAHQKAKKAHKIMTATEYAAVPIKGWHEVCRNIDGFGGVGIRYIANGC